MPHTKSALSEHRDAVEAAAHLAEQFDAADPRAILFFCSYEHDGAAISAELRRRYPAAEVIGCTTAGEFTERGGAKRGVSAMALGPDRVRSCGAALADFAGGVEAGIRAAAAELEASLGVELRSADPERFAGVVLVEGLRGSEEAANHALGMVAPKLAFVGGSAGDDLRFAGTQVFHNGRVSDHGAALLLMEMSVPFRVAKTCSFVPTEHRFVITRSDAPNRVVYEVNGRPVLQAYAEAAGVAAEALDGSVFMRHPWGMVMDGDAWIRSPMRTEADGGLKFYCQIEEGMELFMMRGTDLVGETRAAFRKAEGELSAPPTGALVFNCILRRLELDAEDTHSAFRESFSAYPTAGFHTYGESYLGHINQTCTGLVFA